jgi:hypothetical protein
MPRFSAWLKFGLPISSFMNNAYQTKKAGANAPAFGVDGATRA